MPAPPMPEYNVPGLMRLEAHFLQNGQHVMNTHWFKSNLNETSPVQMELVANTYKNWWTSAYKPYVSSDVTLYEIIVKELAPNGQAILITDGLPVAGQRNNPALPNSVTLAVHWGTGRVGRSTHGRTYVIGLTEDMVDKNTCTEAAGIQAQYDALRTTFDNVSVNVEFSIVSFVSNNAWRTEPLVTPITGVAVESTIDSQRRRLPGRGQ